MSAIQRLIERRPLITFFTLAYALAWIPLIGLLVGGPLDSARLTSPPVAILVFLTSYAPAFAAFLVLWLGRDHDERRAYLRRLRTWRVGWVWYLAALGLPALGYLLTAIPVTAFLHGSVSLMVPSAFIIFALLINPGEELGWRAYALPQMQRRFGPFSASVLLGLLWGAWHLPLYMSRPSFIAAFLLATPALSILMTWIFNNTAGSFILMALFHWSFDAVPEALRFSPPVTAPLVFALLAGSLWLLAGIVLWVTRGRLGLASAKATLIAAA
jgi:membrane protease YdiL (CAAX protease family)